MRSLQLTPFFIQVILYSAESKHRVSVCEIHRWVLNIDHPSRRSAKHVLWRNHQIRTTLSGIPCNGPITCGGLARFAGNSARLLNTLKINLVTTWKNLNPTIWDPTISMPGIRARRAENLPSNRPYFILFTYFFHLFTFIYLFIYLSIFSFILISNM